jgi:hypothetical protein
MGEEDYDKVETVVEERVKPVQSLAQKVKMTKKEEQKKKLNK